MKKRAKKVGLTFVLLISVALLYQIVEHPFEQTHTYYLTNAEMNAIGNEYTIKQAIMIRGGEDVTISTGGHGYVESGSVPVIDYVANPFEHRAIERRLGLNPIDMSKGEATRKIENQLYYNDNQ